MIRGRQRDDSEGRIFLHRGIAARQFQRMFVLADGVEVGEAIMENGLLHVDLTRAVPETVVQTINIRKGVRAMNTRIELNTEGDRIVYVKAVDVADLPREVREQAGDLDQLYAVHDSEGQQLGAGRRPQACVCSGARA